MGAIQPWHLILLLIVVLIVFGPGKLPDIGKALGQSMREFREATKGMTDAISSEQTTPPPPAPQTRQAPPPAAPTMQAAPPPAAPQTMQAPLPQQPAEGQPPAGGSAA
jgi:sec-independent protein translocase protein TatA